MKQTEITINEGAILAAFEYKQAKFLYMYMLTVCATAGYGYISTQDYVNDLSAFTRLSKRTMKRWIAILEKREVITVKKGVIYPISKRKFVGRYQPTRNAIRFVKDDLDTYYDFKRHIIQQYALLTQNRFEYGFKKMSVASANSLVHSGKIENTLEALKSRKQAGCSISQLQKRLHLDKKTISEALKGYTEKQINYSDWIRGNTFRIKYGTLIDRRCGHEIPTESEISNVFKVCFQHDAKRDMYRLGISLASRVVIDSSLKRDNYKYNIEPDI